MKRCKYPDIIELKRQFSLFIDRHQVKDEQPVKSRENLYITHNAFINHTRVLFFDNVNLQT